MPTMPKRSASALATISCVAAHTGSRLHDQRHSFAGAAAIA
jgi:hypothetical protein